MKILVVSEVGTHPTTAGNMKLILEYCELIRSLGHEIYFLHICPPTFSPKTRAVQKVCIIETRSYWREYYLSFTPSVLFKIKQLIAKHVTSNFNHGYCLCDDYYPTGLSTYVKRINKRYNFDGVIVNYYNLSKLLKDVCEIPRRALFTHDYFSYKNLLIGRKNYKATTPNEEAKACQRSPYIFAMQDEEAVFFSKLSPKSKILLNYANYEYKTSSIVGNHNLVFLSGGNEFNVNGISWFIKKIFPKIINDFKDAKLIIGGSICKELSDVSQDEHIELQGFVDNIKDFFDQGDVAINPVYEGTGLKIKTFESLSNDKIVIVHPHSAIGIYKKELSPLYVANKDSDWLKYLHEIWGDEAVINEKKEEARKYMSDMEDFVTNQYKIFLYD